VDLILATANPGKVAELRRLLAGTGISVHERPLNVPETVEDAPTLEGNARKKAAEIRAATGAAALADDTGLFVDELDGGPGVLTGRFGGWPRLLDALDGVPPPRRTARFVTVLVVSYPDGRPDVVVEGVSKGSIATGPVGEGGFGYDPVFLPDDGGGRSFAEMEAEQKNLVSHRGRALRSLVDVLTR
jgi:XTP/dITP diphosphohydrolase